MVYVRDVGRPQVFRPRATLPYPIRDGGEYMPAELPVNKILRAAHGQLPAIRRFAGGEDIPGFAALDNRRIVGSGKIPGECVNVRPLRCKADTARE